MELNVNGKIRQIDAPAEMPLLWALRDLLGLTGTKFGCGMAQCGACTVHVDGRPRRACVTPVGTLAGKKITTIEGLSPDGSHPVQRAWSELDVVQCGYCQAGQIMSAVALLAAKPDPGDDDIDSALAGNICRCGTYQRIRAAIHRAAEIASGPGGSSPDSAALDAARGVAPPRHRPRYASSSRLASDVDDSRTQATNRRDRTRSKG